MAAHRPIAHRAFTVLLAALLVGSLVAPIAASSPAAAQSSSDGGYIDGSFDGTCESKLRFAFPISCPNAAFAEPDVDQSSTSATEIDIHTGMQGVYEGQKQIDSVYSDYLQDTETLASLEARNAIADAYENNSTAIEAQAAGQEAINEYYAHHQIQLLEIASADSQQLAYYANITLNNDNISDQYLSPGRPENNSNSGVYNSGHYLGDTVTSDYTLLNGSTHSHKAPRFEFSSDSTWDPPIENYQDTSNLSLDRYNSTLEGWQYTHYHETSDSRIDLNYTFPGTAIVMNQPDAELYSQTVYDYRMTAQLLNDLEEQAQTVQDNYNGSAAEDLYAAMDSGEITPSDVRGAEGMVRYMSGESNSTEQRFNLALRSTLNLASTDVGNTMVVNFDGETERTRHVNKTSGNVSFTYSGSVNETYEGLLFSSETPSGGFETGTTYNASDFNGSIEMVVDGGNSTVPFYQGEFTIEEIYDSEGNAVENVTWEDPKYDSYNSDEFIAALQNASEQRSQIVIQTSDDGGSGGVTIGDLFGGNPAIGLVVVGAIVALFLAGKFS